MYSVVHVIRILLLRIFGKFELAHAIEFLFRLSRAHMAKAKALQHALYSWLAQLL